MRVSGHLDSGSVATENISKVFSDGSHVLAAQKLESRDHTPGASGHRRGWNGPSYERRPEPGS
jgi:hypothetical protein